MSKTDASCSEISPNAGAKRLDKALADSVLARLETLTGVPCQRLSIVGAHPLARRAYFILRNFTDPRPLLNRYFNRHEMGTPSRFSEGDWVQIPSSDEIRATLNEKQKLRGLEFIASQWTYCGGTYRVQKVMRRIIDDNGTLRPIHRTVLLEGVTCGGVDGNGGCGRRCPLMFRDEWLRPAKQPANSSSTQAPTSRARVRPIQEIRATLDAQGKRGGLLFMPEMERWAGQTFPVVHQVRSVFEQAYSYEGYAPVSSELYILQGLQCSGAVLGTAGPCDRRCSLLWHKDWLEFDAAL